MRDCGDSNGAGRVPGAHVRAGCYREHAYSLPDGRMESVEPEFTVTAELAIEPVTVPGRRRRWSARDRCRVARITPA